MNKIQFLLSFISIIPIFAIFAIFLIRNNYSLISKLTALLALIMIGNILNLLHNFDGKLNAISLINITRNMDIGLSLTNISLIIALLVIFIWFIITIYSNRYFALAGDQRFFAFKLFSILLIEFIILIAFSKNLISLFFFYQLLIFCLYFFTSYFTRQMKERAAHNFTLFLLASSFFLFLAIIISYKITGNSEFLNNGIFQNLSHRKYFILLSVFVLAIALIALMPTQILFSQLYSLNAPMLIMVFVIGYGLVNLVVLLKVILNIFGFDYFITNNNNFNLSYILNIIIAINLIISAILVLNQNNLKKMFVLLFFNQLIFSFFLFLVLNQEIDQFIITVISFILSQTLIFLCLGNINLYIFRSHEKQIFGIFHKLKITVALLLFGLFNLIGITPAIGFIEKYSLLENYFNGKFDLNLWVILLNLTLIFISIIKMVWPILSTDQNLDPHDINLAKKIDSNWSLMFPSLIVAGLMFLSFIFSESINDALKAFLF